MSEKMPSDARCIGCGYPLRGLLAPVCPECGLAFDPADPSSYRSSAFCGPFWPFRPGPPELLHALLACACMLAVIEYRSRPHAFYDEGDALVMSSVALLLAPMLLVGYAWCVFSSAVHCERGGFFGSALRAARNWRWVIAPLCLLLGITAGFSEWPLQLRFALSRPSLETEARRLQATNAGSFTVSVDRRIGLYHVEWIKGDATAVRFITDDKWIFVAGFEWAPQSVGPGRIPLAPEWDAREW